MSANYYSIQGQCQAEIEIRKSRFITYLLPIQTEEDFNQHLEAIRKDHPKANHHCSAFILGEDSMIQRMSDDGEPSGTAGMPILEVLRNNHLTFIMAVVVRYFGGIKLGAGGLIRAYSSATSHALSQCTLIQNVNQSQIKLTLDYSHNDTFTYLVKDHQISASILDTTYTDQVSYLLGIPSEDLESTYNYLNNSFKGQMEWQDLGIKAIDLPYHPPKESQ